MTNAWRTEVNYRWGNSTTCCGLCQHINRITHHGIVYFKCARIGVTKSKTTDIRKSGVCDEFIKSRKYE